MLSPSDPREDDEEEVSGLLDQKSRENAGKEDTDAREEAVPLCGILSVKFYRPYFDVDTKDIKTRLYHALVSFKDSSFMNLVAEKPDAYGPFWVCLSHHHKTNRKRFSSRHISFFYVFHTPICPLQPIFIRLCSFLLWLLLSDENNTTGFGAYTDIHVTDFSSHRFVAHE